MILHCGHVGTDSAKRAGPVAGLRLVGGPVRLGLARRAGLANAAGPALARARLHRAGSSLRGLAADSPGLAARPVAGCVPVGCIWTGRGDGRSACRRPPVRALGASAGGPQPGGNRCGCQPAAARVLGPALLVQGRAGRVARRTAGHCGRQCVQARPGAAAVDFAGLVQQLQRRGGAGRPPQCAAGRPAMAPAAALEAAARRTQSGRL